MTYIYIHGGTLIDGNGGAPLPDAAVLIVEHADQWPGAKTSLEDLAGGVIEATRPRRYFSAKNKQWKETLPLHITRPPMFAQVEDEVFRQLNGVELECLELAAHNEMRATGQRFRGAAEVMKISPRSRAKTPRPKGQLNPKFAVGRGNAEALKECIARRRAFLNHYYQALERWRAGDRDVVFPAGTWWMRVFHKAKTADMV